RSSRPALHQLAAELVDRDLAAGRAPRAASIAAAVELLSSPDVTLRKVAASLLARVPSGFDAEHVAAALHRESDGGVAAQLLLIASRSGDVRAALAASAPRWTARWLGDKQAGEACMDAIRMLIVDDAVGRETTQLAASHLERLSDDEMGVASSRLLLAVDPLAGRERLYRLLRSDAAAGRLAAARSLAEYPGHTAELMKAAERHSDSQPELFIAAAESVRLYKPTPEHLARLEAITVTDEGLRQAVLASVRAAITDAERPESPASQDDGDS
ncbi:MAG: hypothetical protein AAF747_12075, partial [Planctomycetota bacterium]